ncbi:spheroidene monooxygenase [Loktanella fryxellensis]|uniref:Spheroidene monooxygenase n=1 Tax=Loktanella fryxellensis TaxID=245187 RepID=A0A1H8CR40_9RHOB|nr:spheroidene monooxygenase [Loktanella fryxellensis]SEM96904.1 spheroidene monooxygenase [Loktanella fryxellensis]
MTQTVTISLYRFSGWRARAWALSMMARARGPLAHTPDIGFHKLCGAGRGHGFTPTINPAVIAILAVWPDATTARARTTDGIFARYAGNADEAWTVLLSPTSAKGLWSGQAPFTAQGPAPTGPLAALTRATIKPRILRRFWDRVPRISDMIGSDPDVTFKIGIGEVPMLHQVTFSVWPDQAAMDAFARTGPHADAIRAVRREGWFAEELYARFTVVSDHGTWGGRSPLSTLTKEAA